MKYVYKDPVENGFNKFYLKKKDHNIIFKNRKNTWKNRYEYYISDNQILIHQFPSFLAIVVALIFYPFSFFVHGFANYNEINGEYKSLLNPKKYGSFRSDTIRKEADLFKKITEKAIF